MLSILPRTVWPTVDRAHEQAVLERLRQVLLGGAEPDGRTAVLAGVLGALDRVPRTLGLHGQDARDAKRRARAIAKGEWSSAAVSAAVQATMAMVMAAVVATTASTGGG